MTATAATTDIDQTITGGSGDDTISVLAATGKEISVSGGAGNDTIKLVAVPVKATATVAADKIDGGDGTDSLSLTTALANTLAATNNGTVTNFETLLINDAHTTAVTLINAQAGLNSATLSTGSNGGSLVYPAGAGELKMAGISAGALTLSDTGTGTSDSLSITHTDATSNADVFAGQALTVTGIETLNIDVTAKGTATQDFGAITMTSDTGAQTPLTLLVARR